MSTESEEKIVKSIIVSTLMIGNVYAQTNVFLSGNDEVQYFDQKYLENRVDYRTVTVNSICNSSGSSSIIGTRSFQFCSKEIRVPTCRIVGLPLKTKTIEYEYACFRHSETRVEGVFVYTDNHYGPCNKSFEVTYCDVPQYISSKVTLKVENNSQSQDIELTLNNGKLEGKTSKDLLLGYVEKTSRKALNDYDIAEEKVYEIKIEDVSPLLRDVISEQDYVIEDKILTINVPQIRTDLINFKLILYKNSWWIRTPETWSSVFYSEEKLSNGKVSFSMKDLRRGNYYFSAGFTLNSSYQFLPSIVSAELKNKAIKFEGKL